VKKSGVAIESLDTDGPTIPQAYTALSQEAFAVWIRMHCLSSQEMEAGRGKLAKAFGLSEARSNVILRELLLKGYVEADAKGPPHPTAFRLSKRCKVVGRNHFIKLSRALDGFGANGEAEHMRTDAEQSSHWPPSDSVSGSGAYQDRSPAEVDVVAAPGQRWLDHEGAPVPIASVTRVVVSEDEHWLLPASVASVARTGSNRSQPKVCQDTRTDGKTATKAGKPVYAKDREHTRTVAGMSMAKAAREHADSDRPENATDSFRSHEYTERSSSRIDPSRMQKRKAEEVERKRDLHTTAARHPDTGKPINWDKLDLVGKPVISFSPSRERRETMVHLLVSEYRRLKPNERKLRGALIEKLTSEFTRIYTRYRRAANVEAGHLRCDYIVAPQERKFAERAAIACLIKGVTPRELLEYWHANIKHFAGGRMKVPSLTFLSQPSFVDEVAVNGFAVSGSSAVEAGGAKSAASGEARRPGAWRPPPRRTPHLGDTSQLHPRLRAELMEAGFNMSKYNDTDLAVIQDYAIEVMGGKTGIKLMPESLRPMIKWAMENTLKTCDPRDFAWRG
jgi:hypothetical protein